MYPKKNMFYYILRKQKAGKVVVSKLENAGLIGFGTGDPVTEESFLSDTCTLYEGRALLVLRKTETRKESKVIVTGENGLEGELKL